MSGFFYPPYPESQIKNPLESLFYIYQLVDAGKFKIVIIPDANANNQREDSIKSLPPETNAVLQSLEFKNMEKRKKVLLIQQICNQKME